MPALLYLAAATTSRLAMRGALILLATFALPVFAYSGIAKVQTGHFNLSDEGSIAGRIADSVNCATIALPADEQPLCPTPGQGETGSTGSSTTRPRRCVTSMCQPGSRGTR